MDGDGRRRRPRRIPAPEAPGGSRRSKRLRERVPVAGPAPRILVSDSESVNRPSQVRRGRGRRSLFHSGGGARSTGGGRSGGPSTLRWEERQTRRGQRGSGRRRPGPSYPWSGVRFLGSGAQRERRTPGEARSHYFREGVRLGRLENRVACVRAEIRRLEGELGPMLEKLHRRRMRMGTNLDWTPTLLAASPPTRIREGGKTCSCTLSFSFLSTNPFFFLAFL
jgi:hypothetical protein